MSQYAHSSLYKRSLNRVYTKAIKFQPEANIVFEINLNEISLKNVPPPPLF